MGVKILQYNNMTGYITLGTQYIHVLIANHSLIWTYGVQLSLGKLSRSNNAHRFLTDLIISDGDGLQILPNFVTRSVVRLLRYVLIW